MSILKSLKSWLETYDGMTLYIKTDTASSNTGEYALHPSGNGKLYRDVLGNVISQNNYVFWAKELLTDEVDREETHDFLEDFCNWIEDKNDIKDYPYLGDIYKVNSIEVSNAMLFDISDESAGIYQIQIQVEIIKESR